MPASPQVFKTPLTELFGIKHPILLAGMFGLSEARVQLTSCVALQG